MNEIEHFEAIYDMLSGKNQIDVTKLYHHLKAVAICLNAEFPYEPEHEDNLHLKLL